MSKYSQEVIEQVRAASDIVDVVGRVVELKSSGGGRLAGLCPFHQDKAPSFTVNRDRQNFYCFGCEAHGDVFGFVVQHEGLSFIEAFRKLADRAGIRLPAPTERDGREEYLRSQLLELGQWAKRMYTDALKDPMKGSSARAYLDKRGLRPETVDHFALGFAPSGWQFLTDAAQKAGHKDVVLHESGLAKRGDRGSFYDLFRDRLMFPIRSVSGDVVAFGGRDLTGDAPGKYINSPENAVYKKSRTLYGLFEARDAIRRENRAVLVEGYFDVLRCHDAGVHNAVATCGTALTSEQARLLKRYAREVVIVFDGDAAGIKAAVRGVAVLAAAGLSVRAVALPNGEDPDDFVKHHGAEAFIKLIESAENFVSFYVKSSPNRFSSIEGKTEVARELFGILLGLSDALSREQYLELVASELQLDPWSVRSEFSKSLQRKGNDAARAAQPETESIKPIVNMDDRNFLAVLMNDRERLRWVQEQVSDIALPEAPWAKVLSDLFNNRNGETLAGDAAAETLYAAASNVNPESVAAHEVLVERRVRRVRMDALMAQREQLQRALSSASGANDALRAAALLNQKIGIEREIQEIGAV